VVEEHSDDTTGKWIIKTCIPEGCQKKTKYNTEYRKRVDGVKDPGWHQRLNDWHSGTEKVNLVANERVLRGGAWDDQAIGCRSANRGRLGAGGQDRRRGFRICIIRDQIGSIQYI